MKDGFIKVAAAAPKIVVADTKHNAEKIKECISRAAAKGAKILVLPELCVTGYTCGDLFYQETLLTAALDALIDIAKFTEGERSGEKKACDNNINKTSDGEKSGGFCDINNVDICKKEVCDNGINNVGSEKNTVGSGVKCDDILVFVGLPFMFKSKIYNVAAAVKGGKILGLTPKSYLPNYNEFYDKRQFASGKFLDETVKIGGIDSPFSARIIYECENVKGLRVAAEICEDLWVMSPPSSAHAEAGATVLVNLSASNETIGKAEYRRSLVAGQSARLISAYIYASAGDGESTSDLVFGGHCIISENGRILNEKKPFSDEKEGVCADERAVNSQISDGGEKNFADGEIILKADKKTPFSSGKKEEKEAIIVSEIDVSALGFERSKLSNYGLENPEKTRYRSVVFSLKNTLTELTREYPKHPFIPNDKGELQSRAELILNMQSHALKKRLSVGFKAVIGISGGLDSTLALLVAVRAIRLLGRPTEDIIGITMPCFGTSDMTYKNACDLMKALKVKSDAIDIKESVNLHLSDIKKYREGSPLDAAYENAQARERTQVLMDVANAVGGIVVGTGDLSESALGYCTYNGDHMSMYAVNSSVPKTLVKYLVAHEAARIGGETERILKEILDTPISPELLPADGGRITQRTEDLIGPYELHDFFLFHTLRFGFSPSKILRIAARSFAGIYDERTLESRLKLFIKRFFANQFKRNCVPDGVKIGSVSLSPRGDFRMPSDASSALWLKEIENKNEKK
jgi:NAD+ synthase (glutamine-hydrolysing)